MFMKVFCENVQKRSGSGARHVFVLDSKLSLNVDNILFVDHATGIVYMKEGFEINVKESETNWLGKRERS